MIFVTLPFPPTSNHNNMPVRGRLIKSPEYRAWRTAAEWSARSQMQGPPILGPYSIVYTAQRPDNRRRDIENLTKSLSDALQGAGIIADDCHCQRSLIEWDVGPNVKDPTVAIRITPMDARPAR